MHSLLLRRQARNSWRPPLLHRALTHVCAHAAGRHPAKKRCTQNRTKKWCNGVTFIQPTAKQQVRKQNRAAVWSWGQWSPNPAKMQNICSPKLTAKVVRKLHRPLQNGTQTVEVTSLKVSSVSEGKCTPSPHHRVSFQTETETTKPIFRFAPQRLRCGQSMQASAAVQAL